MYQFSFFFFFIEVRTLVQGLIERGAFAKVCYFSMALILINTELEQFFVELFQLECLVKKGFKKRILQFQIKAFKWDELNPVPSRLFRTFEMQGGLFRPCQKSCYKAAYFTKPLETWYSTSLDFNKTFNISDVIKMITSALLRMP